jgi:hypothetical protein
MDFFLAVLMLLAVVLLGLFWKEIVGWVFHKKPNNKK